MPNRIGYELAELKHLVNSTALTVISDKSMYDNAVRNIKSYKKCVGAATIINAIRQDSEGYKDFIQLVPAHMRQPICKLIELEIAYQLDMLGMHKLYSSEKQCADTLWKDVAKCCDDFGHEHGGVHKVEVTAIITKPKVRNIMKIEEPVLVVGADDDKTDILTCSKKILVDIIRDAKKQIAADADMAEVSGVFKKEAAEVQKIIDLCVAQLDKRFK